MKHLVITFDKYVSEELWKFILKDCFEKYTSDERGVGGICARYFGNPNKPHSFDAEQEEYLVVCENEKQAKKLAKCMRSNMTPEQFNRVICLEGYEGMHYFENCIRSLQSLEKSLEQILDTVLKPGIVNLDYFDFQQMVQGTENYVQGFFGENEKMKDVLAVFLYDKNVCRCMINLTGDFTMADAGEIGDVIGGYEEALIGAAPEEGGGMMQAMVIYG